jgi:hypothetical protein
MGGCEKGKGVKCVMRREVEYIWSRRARQEKIGRTNPTWGVMYISQLKQIARTALLQISV